MSGMTRGGSQVVQANNSPLVIPITTDFSTDTQFHWRLSGPIIFIFHDGKVWYSNEYIGLEADIFEPFSPELPDTWPPEWRA
ncbi:MAG: hypothetical protein QY314_02535 [Candidatus Dojkabacteria bacterium]|nr:MAG: hypothetical protein QY314_02535 [Candidatus Dojkabacteria bacterium]